MAACMTLPQTSGEPGKDDASFFIRGVTTFGYHQEVQARLPAPVPLKAREEETVRPAPVHQEVPEVREEETLPAAAM